MIQEILGLGFLGSIAYILYKYPKHFIRNFSFLFIASAIISWVLVLLFPFLAKYGLSYFFIVYLFVFLIAVKYGTEGKEEEKTLEEKILEKLKKEVEEW